MDFIIDIPKSKKKNDSIFVVIEKLSKATHFILVNLTYKAVNIVDIFLKEIFRLHGIPKEIILDREGIGDVYYHISQLHLNEVWFF